MTHCSLAVFISIYVCVTTYRDKSNVLKLREFEVNIKEILFFYIKEEYYFLLYKREPVVNGCILQKTELKQEKESECKEFTERRKLRKRKGKGGS